MSTKVQITGGAFQTPTGDPLSNGYLLFSLSQDAQVTVSGVTEQVGAGEIISVPLDDDGNIVTSPEQLIWPNDVLTPANTFYTVSAYSSIGQLVWGPNAQQVFSTPSPFDVGAWVPGVVSLVSGSVITYDIGFFLSGSYGPSQIILLLPIERPVRFVAGLLPSTAACHTASTGNVVLTIAQNGTSFGTLTFGSGETTGVYASSVGASFLAGDILTITTPSSTDATLASIGLILSGTTVSSGPAS
jgi:hypothetical protein